MSGKSKIESREFDDVNDNAIPYPEAVCSFVWADDQNKQHMRVKKSKEPVEQSVVKAA